MKDDDVKKGLDGHAKVINEILDNQKIIVKKVDELEAKLVVAKTEAKKEEPKKEEAKTEEPKKEEPKKEEKKEEKKE
jgi:hypothetical protein